MFQQLAYEDRNTLETSLRLLKHKDPNLRADTLLHTLLPPQLYCKVFNSMPKKCLEISILELWNFDANRISRLSQKDIINAVNEQRKR